MGTTTGSAKRIRRRANGRASARRHGTSLRKDAPLALVAAGIALLALIGWLVFAGRVSHSEWGPLAVSRLSLGGDAALTSGTLRISDDCVMLEDAYESATLLVWPPAQATWDASVRRIWFQNRNGRVIDLGDGQRVSLGGSGMNIGDSASGEATTWDAWVTGIEWEAEPDPACSADAYWWVGQAADDS